MKTLGLVMEMFNHCNDCYNARGFGDRIGLLMSWQLILIAVRLECYKEQKTLLGSIWGAVLRSVDKNNVK